MRSHLLALCVLMTSSAFGADRCFELSTDRDFDGSMVLCIKSLPLPDVEISVSHRGATVATYRVQLISRARCIDCNADVFELKEQRALDFLRITFDGKVVNGTEAGRVRIGGTRYRYRGTHGGAVAEPAAGPPPSPGPTIPPPDPGMSAKAFEALLSTIEGQFTVSGMKSTVESAAKVNRFTSEQAAALIKKVGGMSLKVEAAQLIVPKIVDPENVFLVSAEIREDASKFLRPAPPREAESPR